MLDDIHRRHREARAIYEASDFAVELDVIEAVFTRLDFQWGFFGQIAHRLQVGVAIKRVIVKR